MSSSKGGRFIIFEGIDGSGKSSQAAELWSKNKHNAILVNSPGGCAVGNKIRDIIIDFESDPLTTVMLFIAAQYELYESTIRPALKDGKTVICDRFLYSTVVYQCMTQWKLESKISTALIQLIDACNINVPHTVVYLDTPTAVALSRIDTRWAQRAITKYESRHYLRSCKSGYDKLFVTNTSFKPVKTIKFRDKADVLVVEGSASFDCVHEEIVRRLDMKH